MKVVVVGGSDAGISAALRARELDPRCEVRMIVADAYPNFSICGLPFFLSGEIADWRTLAHRTIAEIEATGIRLELDCTVTRVEPGRKRVVARYRSGAQVSFEYDAVIVGTGAAPIRPRIEGMESPGVFVLHSMEESFAFDGFRDRIKPASAAIVGGGYIGLEMADALRHRDIGVTLIEQLPTVMKTVDPAFGARVARLLESHGVIVLTDTAVRKISTAGAGLSLDAGGELIAADIVLAVVGVRPSSDLAAGAGIATDERGAIVVDDHMQTNLAGVYAAGDCVQTWNRLLRTFTYMPLGTTSHKQGRVAGENAVGGNAAFAGSIGTQSVKIFEKVVAATGLREAEAAENGFAPLAVEIMANDHKAYYPGAKPMDIRVVGDRNTHRLLGAQIIGAWGTEVSKRIDIFATAIFNDMRIEQLNDLDLSYTPPLSSPWDPVQMAAQTWLSQALTAKESRAVYAD